MTDQHRPSTRPEFLAAALSMRDQGLMTDDICNALGLSRNAVRELLFEIATGEVRFPSNSTSRNTR